MQKFLKWFFIVIIILAVIAVLGFKTIEIRMLPEGKFTESTPPTLPVYTDSDFWFAHPNIKDTSDLIPGNVDVTEDLVDKPVDVFFIHSTGYVGPGGWNSSMAQENSETQSLEYMLSSMASAFNGCCRIYAPNYRQAHLAAFTNDDEESSFAALDLAYSDVERAFDYFLEHFNHGRPFIIVAHSQGTLHGLRLMANRIENSDLKNKLVAAYTIGYWLPMNMFERTFTELSLCQYAEQTNCIVSYDTFGEGGKMSAGMRHWYPQGWETSTLGDIACVNPLTWTTNTEKASASMHKGAFPVEFKRSVPDMIFANNAGFKFETLPDLTRNLTWAKCNESGLLNIAEQQGNAFSNHLSNDDKSYHILDFSLFYGNLRQNAIVRSNAYINNNKP